MTRLAGRTAIVTGSSRGIGAAIAERLARDGAAVAVNHLDEPAEARAIVDRIAAAGGRALAVDADMRAPEAIGGLFERAEAALGAVDIVVANAGVNLSRRVAECTEAEFDAIFSLNARGTFFVLREAARRLKAGGKIIAITSNMTLQGRAGVALYAASKAAVEQFVRVLAKELGPEGITVNAVAPGPTDTRMVSALSREWAPEATPLGRLGRPADIADVVAFLASDDAHWITGQIIHANGGIV
jgi:3-oxoacyl-[acyl-carrier protein] reductase